MNITGLGILSIHGAYARTSTNGFRTMNFCWWIDVNSIGECHLYTNDALTDCYTSDNAYCTVSMDDCLNKVREIIKEAAA
jgi:hypothetical protein